MTLNFHRPRQLADALIDQMIARRWGRVINITGKSEPEHTNGAFCAKAGMTDTDRKFNRMRPSIVRLFGDRTPLLR